MAERLCGNCRFTKPAADGHVYCLGAPPTVISATPTDAGLQVSSQSPILSAGKAPCALHKRRSMLAWVLRR